MATKKSNVSSVKGLVVRSVEDRRGRGGYNFTSVPQFIDVQKDGLTDEQVAAIQDDNFLMAVEVDKAPKGVANAFRRNEDGTEWTPGNYAVGNATLETATAEMVEEAKEGNLHTMHPTAPGGETVSGALDPESIQANIDRLTAQQMPEGKASDKKRGRGRPPGRRGRQMPTTTAKTASRDGDKHGAAGKGASEVNEE